MHMNYIIKGLQTCGGNDSAIPSQSRNVYSSPLTKIDDAMQTVHSLLEWCNGDETNQVQICNKQKQQLAMVGSRAYIRKNVHAPPSKCNDRCARCHEKREQRVHCVSPASMQATFYHFQMLHTLYTLQFYFCS